MTALVRPFALPATLTIDVRDAVRDAALRALADVRAEGATRWVLDGAGVSAVDAAGVGLLLQLEKRTREAGLQWTLGRPAPVLVATLRAAGLHELLDESPG